MVIAVIEPAVMDTELDLGVAGEEAPEEAVEAAEVAEGEAAPAAEGEEAPRPRAAARRPRASRPDPRGTARASRWPGSSPASGNPDDRYARTRHNVGRMVVEELAGEAGERFRKARFLPVETAEIRVDDERVVLARSTRYMNESGPGYASLANKLGVEPDHAIAVHDELGHPRGHDPDETGRRQQRAQRPPLARPGARTVDYLRVRVGPGCRRAGRIPPTSCSSPSARATRRTGRSL